MLKEEREKRNNIRYLMTAGTPYRTGESLDFKQSLKLWKEVRLSKTEEDEGKNP